MTKTIATIQKSEAEFASNLQAVSAKVAGYTVSSIAEITLEV